MIKPLESNQAIAEQTHTIQEQDRTEFASIVRKYQHLVTSIAYSVVGDFQRSEDIAQKAFLLAWEKGHRKDEPYIRSWLRTTATNLSRNENRLMHNRSISLDSYGETAQPSSTTPDQQTRRDILWQSIAHIPENYRQVLILYYRQEHSVRQVADLLELSEDAVKQRLSRGRAMLKQEVQKWVDEALQENEPNPSFAAGVLATIPTSGAIANTAVKSGVSYGLSSLLGKVFGFLSSGAIAGLLGGLAGAGIGLLGAKMGINNSIKHATSDEEKQLASNLYSRIVLYTAVFLISQLVLVFGFRGSTFRTIGLLSSTSLFTLMIIWETVSFTRNQNALHKIHGKPAWPNYKNKPQGKVTPLGLAASILGFTAGIWTWLLVLAGIGGYWNWLLGIGVTLLALLIVGGTLAFRKMEQDQQTRFYGYWCLFNAWLQLPITIAFWWTAPQIDKINLGLRLPTSGTGPSLVPLQTLVIAAITFVVLNVLGIVILRRKKESSKGD